MEHCSAKNSFRRSFSDRDVAAACFGGEIAAACFGPAVVFQQPKTVAQKECFCTKFGHERASAAPRGFGHFGPERLPSRENVGRWMERHRQFVRSTLCELFRSLVVISASRGAKDASSSPKLCERFQTLL
jgi:hypothetical protein